MSQCAFDFLVQDARVEEILNSNAESAHLVAVGWTDTASGGADCTLTQKAFGDLVDGDVIRGDDVGV